MDKELDLSNLSDEEVTEEYSLMYSTDAGPRIFVLNNANTTTLLGVLLEETDDSFLVAIPSRLTENTENNRKEHVIIPFVPVPYIRLLKSAVMSVLYPYGEFADKYLEYLAEKGKDIYPELEDVMEDIKSEINAETEADAEIMEMSLNTNSGVKEKALGMSDKELRDYLNEKYNNGEVSNGNGKKH